MKIVVLVLCLAALSCTHLITQQKTALSHKHHSLGFSNYTDPSVTDQQLKTIINLIRAASGFYKDDVQANAKYLKENLDKLYADDFTTFFILIQTSVTNVTTEYLWKPMSFVVSLNSINIINPSWSYFIYQTYLPSVHFDSAYAFINQKTVSPKLSAQDLTFIQTTITNNEPDHYICHCVQNTVFQIQDTLSDHFSKLWSVVCDSTGSTNAYVDTLNGHWGAFKGKNCYYTMFEYFSFC